MQKPIPFDEVRLSDTDGFWAPRLRTNREVTLREQWKQLEETGRIDNLLRAGGKLEGTFEGYRFNDSDVYKWIEAASYSLAHHPDPEIERQLDLAFDAIECAQEPSGYINSHYTLLRPDDKWKDLAMGHEMYCAGHLIEAAVAHHKVTGSSRLLDIARRFADHIDSVFGPGKQTGYCGHEEIELALVKLYLATGEDRYFRLASFFIDTRGMRPSPFDLEFHAGTPRGNIVDGKHLFYDGEEYDGAYAQDHLPVREQSEVVGHAVRAMYLYCAMADIALETRNAELIAALDRLWSNLTTRKMYVTGGIGPSGRNEGFTGDYDLPNETAYAETCASVGLVMWAHRMMLLHDDARYADVMERALYNGVLAGVSLDGKRFFYENPLASDGIHHRQGWFSCACCPPNLARLFASLGGYALTRDGDELTVNLFIPLEWNGIKIETGVPWDGKVAITVGETDIRRLRIRVPDWALDAGITINDAIIGGRQRPDYFRLDRDLRAGERVEINFDPAPRYLRAHPAVTADVGRAALQYGPLIYCLEGMDYSAPLTAFEISLPQTPVAKFRPDLLGGVMTLTTDASTYNLDQWERELYAANRPQTSQTQITFLPYFAWGNREASAMQVWTPSI